MGTRMMMGSGPTWWQFREAEPLLEAWRLKTQWRANSSSPAPVLSVPASPSYRVKGTERPPEIRRNSKSWRKFLRAWWRKGNSHPHTHTPTHGGAGSGTPRAFLLVSLLPSRARHRCPSKEGPMGTV